LPKLFSQVGKHQRFDQERTLARTSIAEANFLTTPTNKYWNSCENQNHPARDEQFTRAGYAGSARSKHQHQCPPNHADEV